MWAAISGDIPGEEARFINIAFSKKRWKRVDFHVLRGNYSPAAAKFTALPSRSTKSAWGGCTPWAFLRLGRFGQVGKGESADNAFSGLFAGEAG